MSALALLLPPPRVLPLLVLARGALFRGDAARRVVEEEDGRRDGDGPRRAATVDAPPRAWTVGIDLRVRYG